MPPSICRHQNLLILSIMPPAAKKAKRSSCDINELSDNDLSEIFKRLPPYDRLIVSEVCRRWHKISRDAWLDITKLDLSPSSKEAVAAVIKQCPKLEAIFASQASFGLRKLFGLRKIKSISSVKFYGCKFELDKPAYGEDPDVFEKIFSRKLVRASWTELVLHDAYFCQITDANQLSLPEYAGIDATYLPVSLTRLQLSGLYLGGHVRYSGEEFLEGLRNLLNLECLILHTTPEPPSAFGDDAGDELVEFGMEAVENEILETISTLKNLKELCFGPAKHFDARWFKRYIVSLPKLEVLCINDIDCYDEIQTGLEKIITENAVLRILVLSGKFVIYDSEGDVIADDDDDVELIPLPARKRFPNGFGSDPLPLLHIFVGREASENNIFEKSSPDAAIIHPINAPMPEFLNREDITPIFEGVWVAEKIKEAAENGARLWDYKLYDDASSIQHPDE